MLNVIVIKIMLLLLGGLYKSVMLNLSNLCK